MGITDDMDLEAGFVSHLSGGLSLLGVKTIRNSHDRLLYLLAEVSLSDLLQISHNLGEKVACREWSREMVLQLDSELILIIQLELLIIYLELSKAVLKRKPGDLLFEIRVPGVSPNEVLEVEECVVWILADLLKKFINE